MVVSMKYITAILIMTTFSAPSVISFAAEQEEKPKHSPLIIQSQVKGSQEQPKVTYIMPWQGVNKPISITEHQRQARLPTFKPINPKVFRKQVAQFKKSNKAQQQ